MPDGNIATAIYIASPEGDTGKSTIALGILQRLAATVPKVGVFRPITRLGEQRDYILELLLAGTTAGLSYDECVGVSYQQVHEDPDAAITDIVDRFHQVAEQCDAVLIVGSDYTDIATPSELSMNARIAVNLGAPVVLAVKAADRTPDEVAHVVEVCLAELAHQHAHAAAVVANRCDPAKLTAVADALKPLGPPAYVLPEEPCWSRRRSPNCRPRSTARWSPVTPRCCPARRWGAGRGHDGRACARAAHRRRRRDHPG